MLKNETLKSKKNLKKLKKKNEALKKIEKRS